MNNLSPVDEKLQLLSLSNEDFANGLANMIKLFTSAKDAKSESVYSQFGIGSSNSAPAILLSDHTPVLES